MHIATNATCAQCGSADTALGVFDESGQLKCPCCYWDEDFFAEAMKDVDEIDEGCDELERGDV